MARYVIRPGETDFDVQDRIQGDLNLPMTDRGRTQVAEIVEALRGRQLDTIYASPNEPALSTAEQIAKALDIPLKVLDRLSNVNLGLWQGLSRSEIRSKQPRLLRQWEEAPESVCAPQGESGDEAIERVQRALRKLVRRTGSFAVVASEPLATLVTSVLKGEAPRLCGPGKMATQRSRLECLESSETAT
ncbi:histidine phosphatase family protein [Planctomicrobium piriforme]|uniref:Probable phosphoglycerate mutase n=1 Tax=Planctomicrobium piriforme TaxID=1576369 RepID=A0A1I3MTS8_9PLAN|nr:histidine phosphatase family protein [Planctomicrobium piriforme]SFJ00190.1 probable phosphoglycerate mutase [Planctomicrobium piriforme]